jgi:glycine cleavage system aminomethyltransferase T
METTLHEWILANGTPMVGFFRWVMPVQYQTGPQEGHLRVRQATGLLTLTILDGF